MTNEPSTRPYEDAHKPKQDAPKDLPKQVPTPSQPVVREAPKTPAEDMPHDAPRSPGRGRAA